MYLKKKTQKTKYSGISEPINQKPNHLLKEEMKSWWGAWGVEGLGKKEKELMDMDNSVVIAGGRGV